jgi:hypothetical protein
VTPIVILLGLVAFAYLASFVLSSRDRHGYGIISGSEIIAVGLIAGPAGLGFITSGLLEAASPAATIAIGWLGFRLGLRFRRSELPQLTARSGLTLLLESVVATGALYGLVELANLLGGLGMSSTTRLAIAAIGSPSTKSAILWARTRYSARGPVSDCLWAITRFDDLIAVLILSVVFVLSPDGAAAGTLPFSVRMGASLLLGPVLALLAGLLLGRGERREDLLWIAVIGFSALGTGLALRLGLSALGVAMLFGITLGWTSPQQADRIAELTEATERPTIQVLLLLIGAWLELRLQMVFLALGFGALRVIAKLVGGFAARIASPVPGRPLWLGAGLLPSGGLVTVMVLSVLFGLPSSGQPVLGAFVGAAAIGDLIGGPALIALLRRSGEVRDDAAARPDLVADAPRGNG